VKEITDTIDIREKMMKLWGKLDRGEISHAEARVHIGFARTVLDTLKVEIAAAHLQAPPEPISVARKALRAVPTGRKVA